MKYEEKNSTRKDGGREGKETKNRHINGKKRKTWRLMFTKWKKVEKVNHG